MSNVAALYDAPDTPSSLTRPLFPALVAAGFPSPADDHLDRDLDEALYQPGFHYQKYGVMLLDLLPVAQVQADLFDPRDRAREARLVRALDLLNADHGARTVRVGNTSGERPVWARRQAFRSPRYTTNWRELPVVR